MKNCNRVILFALTAITAFFLLSACASREAIRKPVYKRGSSSPVYTSANSGKRYHVVRKGDTLYRIARKYGIPVSDLERANKLRNSSDIKVGTRIYLPPKSARGKYTRPNKKKKTVSKPVSASVKKLMWPLKKIDISSRFGVRSNGKHDGVDLRAPKGTPIYAAQSGVVIFSGVGPSGYGNMVIIKHDSQTITVYAHNNRNLVTDREYVKQGAKIATVGRTGRATGYHVHFELRINRKPVDPVKYLGRKR